jgi:hypothetical protein
MTSSASESVSSEFDVLDGKMLESRAGPQSLHKSYTHDILNHPPRHAHINYLLCHNTEFQKCACYHHVFCSAHPMHSPQLLPCLSYVNIRFYIMFIYTRTHMRTHTYVERYNSVYPAHNFRVMKRETGWGEERERERETENTSEMPNSTPN